MKFDLNGKTINIPDAAIDKLMKTLNLKDRDEAIGVFLFDEGFVENEEVAMMTAKAKAAGTGAKATGERKERKAPERKPDECKREIVEMFANLIRDQLDPEAEVTNIERMIAFTVGNEKFELTLTKKRKPKE